MNCVVRIVKHGRNDDLKSLPLGQDEKTHRQSNREIISTVKSWVAELKQRKRASEHSRTSAFK
jgi:hypothetical protein